VAVIAMEGQSIDELVCVSLRNHPIYATAYMFYGHSEQNGDSAVFSNFYVSRFTDSTYGLTFDTVEQYMHWRKALLFGDTEIAAKILAAKDPAVCKALGRRVRNFDAKIWSAQAIEIVERGIALKFEQNPELRRILLSTSGSVLVECAENDSIWGIGINKRDQKCQDVNTWKGTNLLGVCLMHVRDKMSGRTL
jgi:ribA/ribD-fused uncharacterized protein